MAGRQAGLKNRTCAGPGQAQGSAQPPFPQRAPTCAALKQIDVVSGAAQRVQHVAGAAGADRWRGGGIEIAKEGQPRHNVGMLKGVHRAAGAHEKADEGQRCMHTVRIPAALHTRVHSLQLLVAGKVLQRHRRRAVIHPCLGAQNKAGQLQVGLQHLHQERHGHNSGAGTWDRRARRQARCHTPQGVRLPLHAPGHHAAPSHLRQRHATGLRRTQAVRDSHRQKVFLAVLAARIHGGEPVAHRAW